MTRTNPTRAPLVLLAATLACAAQRSVEKAAAEALISDEQEKQLGLQVQQELKQQNVRYVEDPQVVSFVHGITDKILPFAKKDRPGVDWTVQVIDDPKTVNAFATPGGFLYVYSGLLLAADDPAEVAGVLGHESGHVVARHSARQMVDAMGLDAVTAMAVGKNPSGVAQIASAIATKGVLLKYSREDELEADQYGARYSSAAGYDPHGIATFFQKLLAQEGKQPAFLAMLSDHPATPERIQKVDQYIAEHHLGGTGGHDRSQLDQVKARIKALPPPPPKPGAPSQGGPSASAPSAGAGTTWAGAQR